MTWMSWGTPMTYGNQRPAFSFWQVGRWRTSNLENESCMLSDLDNPDILGELRLYPRTCVTCLQLGATASLLDTCWLKKRYALSEYRLKILVHAISVFSNSHPNTTFSLYPKERLKSCFNQNVGSPNGDGSY
jgi:hypothetical protein